MFTPAGNVIMFALVALVITMLVMGASGHLPPGWF